MSAKNVLIQIELAINQLTKVRNEMKAFSESGIPMKADEIEPEIDLVMTNLARAKKALRD